MCVESELNRNELRYCTVVSAYCGCWQRVCCGLANFSVKDSIEFARKALGFLSLLLLSLLANDVSVFNCVTHSWRYSC